MKNKTTKILIISEMAFKVITTLLICVLIGVKLDNYFNTKPLWTIIFSALGLGYLVSSIVMLGSKKNEL